MPGLGDDAELLRALHAEHGDALFAYALRMCSGDRQRAEDLVQETLLRAWQHPEALDPERGSVRAWLARACERPGARGRGGRAGAARAAGRGRPGGGGAPRPPGGPARGARTGAPPAEAMARDGDQSGLPAAPGALLPRLLVSAKA